ncbi:hypothetical protein FGE12_23120 [Aggregicoccus sp. 17bor-14]|uniref:hypothetical protein n=1 Tax=Myxococcaceae TaxID=31 RepID=UPI00129C3DFB|nr:MULTISPECIES: hypothetical protein [Myxococcaceae]MBF5045315.1 hypothetical protein [Simulacricoccus sp. 17bor-14]MRI91057.1 hypothetical protein [Aggregicoccus sp. 17bor-14]
MPSDPGTMIVLMLVTIFVGSAAIWGLMAWRHARLRAELAQHRTLFLERDVRVAVGTLASLGAGKRWMVADVWITDRAAVLLMRQLIGMPQPPVALFRTQKEASAQRRALVHSRIVTGLVVHGAEHALTLQCTGAFTYLELKLRPVELEALVAALQSNLNRGLMVPAASTR